MKIEQEDNLQASCKEINAIGDVNDLLLHVWRRSDEILSLSRTSNPTVHMVRITLLSDEIDSLIGKIKSLLRKEWTDARLEFKAQWVLTPKDFNLKDDGIGSGLRYERVKVRTVVVDGHENDLMKGHVTTQTTDGNLVVTLNRMASVLETCSLNSTLAVLLEVRYFADGSSSVESSPPTIGYRTFNLVLNQVR